MFWPIWAWLNSSNFHQTRRETTAWVSKIALPSWVCIQIYIWFLERLKSMMKSFIWTKFPIWLSWWSIWDILLFLISCHQQRNWGLVCKCFLGRESQWRSAQSDDMGGILFTTFYYSITLRKVWLGSPIILPPLNYHYLEKIIQASVIFNILYLL